jgi:hypothetical protein
MASIIIQTRPEYPVNGTWETLLPRLVLDVALANGYVDAKAWIDNVVLGAGTRGFNREEEGGLVLC